ncbi:MAG: cation diffusion facilitator family transporter [Acidimicrobiales bacterium]
MSRSARLWAVLVANLALVGVLIAVGVAAHSLGVWAEGADYLADAAAIAVSLLAIRLAGRPSTPRHPNGYPRATRYAALVNAGWLLVLSLLVAAGASERLVTGAHEVHGLPVLIVSGIAAAVMFAGALLLGGDIDGDEEDEDRDDQDLNMHAVLLDTAADAAAAAGVALAGAVIYATKGTYWLDPTVALVIAAIVGYHATRLLFRIRSALAN